MLRQVKYLQVLSMNMMEFIFGAIEIQMLAVDGHNPATWDDTTNLFAICKGHKDLVITFPCMYGIFTYIWLLLMVKYGKGR